MKFRRLLLFALLFTLAAYPAYAGPLIGALGLLGAWGAGAITATQAVLGLIVTGAQWLISTMMQPKQKDRGVKNKMDTGGDNPPGIIVGEYATAGLLDYANSHDGDGPPLAYLNFVIVLSAIPVSGISNIVFINNERCTIDWDHQDSDGFSYVTDYDKNDLHYCKVKFYDGTQTTCDPWLLSTYGADPTRPWKSTMHLTGCAYVIVECIYSDSGVWSGNPTFRWVVQGVPLYDPRKDSTVGGSGSHRWGDVSTYEFSQNAKVIEYNLIRGLYYDGDLVWGGGAEAYRLPLSYWFAAMNVCDEWVTKTSGDTIRRYIVGGEIHFDDKPIEIIGEINKACCGFTTEYGGTYKTWCGGPGLSVATITDDDFLITEQMTTDRFQPLTSIYNTGYGSYPEPNQQWDTKDGPRFVDAASLASDGQELALDLQLPFVWEKNQVQRVLRHTVLDSRRQVTHQGQLPPEYFILEPNDRVTFFSDFFGYGDDGKDFLVGAKDDMPNVNQQLQLREVDPSDQSWLPAYEMDSRTGPLTVVKPGALNLDFTLASTQINSDVGKDKPAILVTWDWGLVDIDVKNIRFEVRLHGTTDIIAEDRIRNIEEGSRKLQNHVLRFGKTYDVRLKAEPISTRGTNWTAWKTVTLVSLDIPSAPTLTPLSYLASDGNLDFYLKIDWPSLSAEVSYNVRVVENGQEDHYRADVSHKRIKVSSGKTYTVDVRAIGAEGGSRGDWSTATTLAISGKSIAPTAPTSLTAIGDNHRVILKTNKSPDGDFKRVVFYGSNTNDFTTASEVDRSGGVHGVDDHLANNITRYYWATFEDRSGNESAKYPASNTAGISATTIRVVDDDADPTTPSVVAAPTLTLRQNMDGDGVVNSKIIVAWSAPASAVPIKYYEVRVSDGTDTHYHKTKNLFFMIHGVVVGKTYTVSISAISAFGYASAYTNSTAKAVTTGSTAVPAGGSLTLTALKKRIVVDWTDVDDDTYPAYRITYVYRNTTGTTPIPGTTAPYKKIKGGRFVDEGVTTGTTYTYWIIHKDRSGNFGVLSSSAAGTSGGNEVTAFTDLTGVVTDGMTDTTAPDVPTGLTISQYVTGSNIDLDADGRADIAIKATCALNTTGVAVKYYEFTVRDPGAGPSGGGEEWTKIGKVTRNQTIPTIRHSPAIAGRSYGFWVRAVSFNGTASSWSSRVDFTPSKKSAAPSNVSWAGSNPIVAKPKQIVLRIQASTDPDYKQTVYYRNTTNNSATATEIGRQKGTVYHDSEDLVAGTTYYYWAKHEDRSGNLSSSFSSVQSVAWNLIKTADVTVSDLQPDVLNPNTFGLDDVAIDSRMDLTANAQNIAAEITVTFAASPEPTIKRRFMLIGHVTSTSLGAGLPTAPVLLGIDVDTGSGYASTGSAQPIFNPTSWLPLSGALHGVCSLTVIIDMPGSQTSVKFAIKAWIATGNTGSVVQRHLMCIQMNTGS